MELNEYHLFVEKYKDLRSDNTKAFLISFTLLGLAGAFIAISLNVTGLLWLISQIALGIVILQWFFLLHDLGHDHFFGSTSLNVIVGHIASLFCILPFFPWKYIHRTHHLWTGWKDKDPTMTIIIPREVPSWKKGIINFCWKYWIPLFTLSFSFANFWNLAKLNRLYPQHLIKNVFSIMLPICFHLILIWKFGLPLYLHTFALGFIFFLILCDPLLLSQHSTIPQKHSHGKKVTPVHFRDQDQYTRTLIFPHWMSKYLFLGFNNHIVHHLIPTMPGYQLANIKIKNDHDVNWFKWLKKAKTLKGFDLILSEELNLKD